MRRAPAITDKDVADLELATELNADFVALSFVRSAADLVELRSRLDERGSRARIVAKVEKIEAYENLDEIIAASDGVMVARGDYAVEAGMARVPLMQKDTISRATQAGKLVITATQMLESMINAPEPTRAEVADVANAVIDGSSAVMLSAETSVGSYPVEAVRAMAAIAEAAEEVPEIHGRARTPKGDTLAAAVMHSAVELADAIDAAALVVPTATGGAARACSKYRRRRPIIALAHDPAVAAQLTLEWGVYPASMRVAESVDEMIDGALVAAAENFAELGSGATVVLTAGRRTGTAGATNLIMVRELPGGNGLVSRHPRVSSPRGSRAGRFVSLPTLESNAVSHGDHVVQFYERDADLVAGVGDYLIEAAREAAVSVVVATEAHRNAFVGAPRVARCRRRCSAAAGVAPPARRCGDPPAVHARRPDRLGPRSSRRSAA